MSPADEQEDCFMPIASIADTIHWQSALTSVLKFLARCATLNTLYWMHTGFINRSKCPGQLITPFSGVVSRFLESPPIEASVIMVRGTYGCTWLCIVLTDFVWVLSQFDVWWSTSMLHRRVMNSLSQQSYTSLHASIIVRSNPLMLSIAYLHQSGKSTVGPFSPYSHSWLNMESRMFLPFFGNIA